MGAVARREQTISGIISERSRQLRYFMSGYGSNTL